MKKTYYAKQVAPEYQRDDLFFCGKDGKLLMEDDYFDNRVIIDGNREFRGMTIPAYDKIKKLATDLWYDWDNLSSCGFGSKEEFVEYYLSEDNVEEWIKLLESNIDWTDEDFVVAALKLLTGKEWRHVCIRGCMQREWQYMYVNEDISDEDVRYIEMCYFNTGMEFVVYESKKDFDKEEEGCSYYVESVEDLREKLSDYNLRVFESDGYTQTAKYKEVI